MKETQHIPVMLEETMLVLEPRAGGVYVDGTLGGGSHTEALLERSGPTGTVYSFDIYPKAMEHAQRRLSRYGSRWVGIAANFADWKEELAQRGVQSVDGMLLDLGFSSDELHDATIGISFQEEGVLDMRLGEKANTTGQTAAQIVNTWSAQDLARAFLVYADERYARSIAAAIVQARREDYIVTTQHLARVVAGAVPSSYEKGRIHPATRVFLALRMIVNEELEHLKQAIEGAAQILRPGGSLAILTFQSIEDRLVKQLFKQSPWEPWQRNKPLDPSPQELRENPRARSAKLRAARLALR